jgi:hypothetical protein
MAAKWLLLLYRIPSEPSAPRVAAWRALKRMDGAYLQDGAYVAKPTEANRQALESLAHDIRNWGGEASLLDVAKADDERHLAGRVKAALGAKA